MPTRRTTPAENEIQTTREENVENQEQSQTEQSQDTQTGEPASPTTPEVTAGSAPPIKIDVRITSTRNVYDDNTRAMATVTLNDAFVIKGVRVVKGENGLFCSMPARRLRSGEYAEICHPITRDFAYKLNASVLSEYQVHLAQQMEESQQTPHIYEQETDQSFREPGELEHTAEQPDMEMM
jgi:stage V sporulation protein G